MERQEHPHGALDHFFSRFSTSVARATGSHWAVIVAAVAVAGLLIVTDVDTTNICISIVTLLMVFVLQNTQNRDSAALHLKLDEVVRVDPKARDALVGAESGSVREIRNLTHADEDQTSHPTP